MISDAISFSKAPNLAVTDASNMNPRNVMDACDFLSIGNIIGKKWKLSSQVGQGAFGKIFKAVDLNTNEKVAIKFESSLAKRKVLKVEVLILKKLHDSPYISSCHAFGTHTAAEKMDVSFLVMSLHGTNISELRKSRPDSCFSLATTALLGYQMIDSLRWLHQLGYLHRDVKPSNYVIGLTPLPDHHGISRPRIYLIDFGLARRHIEDDGSIRPSRAFVGFRGTTRYASVHAHRGQDLGRRDDLWSLAYVFYEFITGQLPWRRERDKEKISELKESFSKENHSCSIPEPFRLFQDHLLTLEYASAPNYTFLLDLMEKAFNLSASKPTIRYDWEIDKSKPIGLMTKCKQTACDLQQKILKPNLSRHELRCTIKDYFFFNEPKECKQKLEKI